MASVSDPNPDPDSIRSVDPEKAKELLVLKGWMFSFEGLRLLL
jgi:hypothetical protein